VRFYRIIGALSVLALSLVMVACAHSVKPVSDMARNIVAMLDFRFQPESLNVYAGDTVTWVNKGHIPHTTTSVDNGKPDGLWDTPHLARGDSFSYVFSKPGTYHYFCRPHHGLGMKGVVVVTNR
jgi:plastocyanin